MGKTAIRVLLAKSILDVHDRGVRYIARELREAGMEVIFMRFGTPEEIANAALQEDVDAIGLSISTGSPKAVTAMVLQLLTEVGLGTKPIIVGGIIPVNEEPELKRMGIKGLFGPGSYAKDVIECLTSVVATSVHSAA